jgi:hypothetical protein
MHIVHRHPIRFATDSDNGEFVSVNTGGLLVFTSMAQTDIIGGR